MRFPTHISEGLFKARWNRTMSNGWGDLNISKKKVAITGQKVPSGFGVLFGAIGMMIAAASAGKTTLKISYDSILDMRVEGNKLTLEYLDRKGEEKVIMLKPFRTKGFFGGKDSQAGYVADLIEEDRAADPE